MDYYNTLNDIISNLNQNLFQFIGETSYSNLYLTQNDYKQFLLVYQTMHFQIIPNRLSYSITIPKHDLKDKAVIIKLILFSLNHFITHKQTNYFIHALSIMQSLFNQRFIIEDDVTIIFCYSVLGSIQYNKGHNNDEMLLKSFQLFSDIIGHCTVNDSTKDMITQATDFLKKLCRNEIIIHRLCKLNLYELFHYNNESLDLLVVPLFDIIFDISLFHYDSYFFNSFMACLKNEFGKHTLSIISHNIINFIKKMIDKEFNIRAKDDYHFLNSFYFNEAHSKGITFQNIASSKKEYTIIFSFKSLNNPNDFSFPLITFSSLSETTKPLSIYVDQEQKLCITHLGTLTTDISILPNKSYVVLISQKNCMFNIQVNTTKKDLLSNSKVGFFSMKHFAIDIGYTPIDYKRSIKQDNIQLEPSKRFHGHFGTVILLDEYYKTDVIQSILKLKGNYDILLVSGFDMINMGNTAVYDTKLLDYFKQKNIVKSIVTYISPLGVNVNKMLSGRNLKENYVEIPLLQGKMRTGKIDEMVLPTQLKLTLDEFLKLEGIRFIQLHIEYYQQLLDNYKVVKDNDLLVKISKYISEIFKLIQLLIELTDSSFFVNKTFKLDSMCTFIDVPLTEVNQNSNEIIFLFGSLTSLLLNISSISPRHIVNNLNELLSFISVCVFQEDSNQLMFTLKTKLIYFMFNKSLYGNTSLNQMSHFVNTINDCICRNPKGLFNKDFLMAMLTFSDDIIEGYGKLLRTYLETSYEESHDIFICFFYIIATEDKDMKLLIQMLLTVYAFIQELPIEDFTNIIKSVALDQLIINKLYDLKTLVNTTINQANDIKMTVGILIQFLRLVHLDVKDMSGLIKDIEINEITFRSLILMVFKNVSATDSIKMSTNDSCMDFLKNYKGELANKDLLDFWFENIINAYLKIDNENLKQEAYKYIIIMIEMIIPKLTKSEDDSKKMYDVFHSKKFFPKLFLKSKMNDSTCEDLLRISKLIIFHHPKPFIFSLLFKLYINLENDAKASRVEGRSRASSNYFRNPLPKSQTITETIHLPKNLEFELNNSLTQNWININDDYVCNNNLCLKDKEDQVFIISPEDNDKDKENERLEQEKAIDHQLSYLIKILNTLLEIMSKPTVFHSQNNFKETPEIQRNLLVNNINLYIFLYKIFCLQKSINDKAKKLKLFKAIESELLINSQVLSIYNLPYLYILFPIGKQEKFFLEILFELNNEILVLTELNKYFGHITFFFTYNLSQSSLLFQLDNLIMHNKEPRDLKINKDQYFQIEHQLSLIPKLRRVNISLTLFFLIKASVILMKDESINHKIHSEIYTFIEQLKNGLFDEVKILFSTIKKSKASTYDFNEKIYIKMRDKFIDRKKYKLNAFEVSLTKKYKKKENNMDCIYTKIIFNKAGQIVVEKIMRKAAKSFAFPGRASIDKIERKISYESDNYTPPTNNYNKTNNINDIKATDIYIKALKDQKFDLEYKCDYFLFNFPICNLKKTFLQIVFGYHFRDLVFYDEGFINIIKEFKAIYNDNLIEVNNVGTLPYPTKIKNYTINNIRLFLKPATSYFAKTPQLISVGYRNLHYQSTSYKSLKFFVNRLRNVILPNKIITIWTELITNEGSFFGLISLSKNYFQFQSYNDKDPRLPNSLVNDKDKLDYVLSSLDSDIAFKDKRVIFRYSDIKALSRKRFLYSMQASQFFLINGRSYLFNLFSEEINSLFLLKMNELSKKTLVNLSQSIIDSFIQSDYTNKWLKKEISTFDYLIHINMTSRSFNDNNQYPIFPWLEIMQPKNIIEQRDFEFPVSVQHLKKRNQIINQYASMINNCSFPNHMNTHYSTASFVIYYLLRMNPFTYNMIKLQNGVFDEPGRIFHSFEEILSILNQYNDNRELIPEIFFMPELFVNLNYFNYGERQHDSTQLHNIIFNKSNSINAVSFVVKYRKMIESPKIIGKIHKWIDNIFGITQLNTNKASCNIYMKYCYGEKMNFNEKISKMNKRNLTAKEIWTKLRTKITCILNLGQTPLRIFNARHPNNGQIEELDDNNGNDYMIPSTKGDMILNSSSFTVLSIGKEFVYFKRISIGQKSKNNMTTVVYFISKDKQLYSNNLSLETSIMIPKPFTLSYMKHSDKTNKKSFYYAKNLFEIFLTSTGNYIYLFSNYYDQTIKFYSDTAINEPWEFLVESYVTGVAKISDNAFITSHLNGKVIIWLFSYNLKNKSFAIKTFKSFLQKSRITILSYNHTLNLLLTADAEGEICLRSIITLELLTVISPRGQSSKRPLIICNIEISSYNFIYISGYDSLTREFYLLGYTFNGMLFSKLKMISPSFQLLPNDSILIFGRSPHNKPRFLSINPTNFNDIKYYNNSNIITRVNNFVLCSEKKFIYMNQYQNETMQIIILSNEDMEGFCYQPLQLE